MGAMTTTFGAAILVELRSNFCSTLWNAGRRKPRVLPEPVLAMEMRSVPVKARGQDTDCVGVGLAKPSLASFCLQAALKGLLSKATTGTGSLPLSSTACSLAKAAKVVASARSGCGSAAGFENESLRGFGVRSFCFFSALRAARSSGVSFLRFLDFFLSSTAGYPALFTTRPARFLTCDGALQNVGRPDELKGALILLASEVRSSTFRQNHHSTKEQARR